MCKRLLLCLTGIFLLISVQGQSIAGINFSTIDGTSVSMSSYSGKKVVLIIAPISMNDTAKLLEIKEFQFRYGKDSVKLIGILSIEDGYNSGNATSIKNMYLNAGIDIVLTNGMYTKKVAGSSQSPLMKWLTDKTLNTRYNIDAMGIWQKFFVNKQGKLTNVIPPKVDLLDSSVGWVLYKQI